jgi:succinyl-CoA synthetase alpha subunit
LKPDASAVFVAAQHAGKAIEEAIEAEVPLIIAVAEHLPIHDVMRVSYQCSLRCCHCYIQSSLIAQIHSILQSQSKSRLVGANCPGIISPVGKCRIGFQPLESFSPGTIGIVAKSGTLSYEAVASTTRAGLGQSLCISMGGDVLAGTNLRDALEVFEDDDATDGMIVIGEIGGSAEQEAADWIKKYHARTKNPKPIMALVAGLHRAPGRVMGHAGAWVGPGEATAAEKIKIFENAGVKVVRHPEDFGEGMKKLLASTGQKRGLHSLLRRSASSRPYVAKTWKPVFSGSQRRNLSISREQALEVLNEYGVPISTSQATPVKEFLLSIAIDRTSRRPCIVASNVTGKDAYAVQWKFPFDYREGFNEATVPVIADYLGLDRATYTAQKALPSLISKLLKVFMEKEAFIVETTVTLDTKARLAVRSASLGFDDAAFKSSKRQGDIYALRNLEAELPAEVEAEKDGIVYIKLSGDGNIGTLVNGAGLAMNTNDALAALGGKNSNFLDTGGKATSETVKSSFRIILTDPNVKAIFVNIFGGLTLCDMIAHGIILAFRDLNMQVPVVVRLRGTNELRGQKIVSHEEHQKIHGSCGVVLTFFDTDL